MSVHAAELPDEMSLARHWNAARLPAGCHTTDGRTLDVVYRGQWSHGYGPDFRGAILSLENGPTLRGDVELHVCSSMWSRHGHETNSAYDHVALHVVWLHDVPILSPAPVLELSRYVSLQDLTALPPPGALDSSFCSVFQRPELSRKAIRIIEAAGDARFEERCITLEGELECASPEQLLYAALMECMGYSENKLPFRLLAEALPYEQVRHTDPARVAARLQNASGLLQDVEPSPLLQREQWRLGRGRPANHPLRRMLGAAELIARAERQGGLVAYLAAGTAGMEAADMARRVQVRSADGAQYIGTDRGVQTLVNAVLPFAVALARTCRNQGLERSARQAWLRLPRSGTSRVERAMRDHLQVPSRTRLLNRARHQQGLLHLYKRYCAQRLCEVCPLSRLASEQE